MPIQSPPGPSRRTLVVFLILYLLSIGTSVLFLVHYIGNPFSKGTSATVLDKPVSPQGKHPAVVYFYHQPGSDGFLMLYNVSTGQKVQVLQIKNSTIAYAQVSPDGQWILFIAGNQLQMVRINGQQHEILSPIDSWQPPIAQWSLDQKSVLISTERDNTSTLSILDMTTKTMRTTLQITSTQYVYQTIKWLDKTHVLVLANGRYQKGKDIPPKRLYLLDVTARPARQARDLKLLLLDVKEDYLKFDTSPDGKRLFVAQQVQGYLTLWVEPATGGKRQILLNNVRTHFINSMRVFTHYLLLTAGSEFIQYEMWRMPLDASSHTVLFSNTDYTVYVLNRMTQYARSDMTPDETMLAFETYNRDAGPLALLVSPLPEAKATKIEVFPLGLGTLLFIVGWTAI